MSTFRIWQERLNAFKKYYKSPKFALIDFSFGFVRLLVNPYRTCRKFLQKKGEEIVYAYGETPYTTYEKIAKEVGIGPEDVWMELGAGRGKGCFWMAHFTGCKVIGVEWIPSFIRIAKWIQFLFRVNGLEFINQDISNADLSHATVIYLYGLYPDLKIKKRVRVITTGEPLDGYRVIKHFWVRFPWGRTCAYIQEKLDEKFCLD